MSVFGELRDAGPGGAQEERRHVLTTAVSVMLADGDEGEREIDILLGLGGVSPILGGMAREDLATVVSAVKNEIRENGHRETIEAAAARLSPALRETAFCFAVLVALADDRIDDGEVASLLDKSEALGLTRDRFDALFTAMDALTRRPEG